MQVCVPKIGELTRTELDPHQLHRQLRRRNSRVRKCFAIKEARQSWCVAPPFLISTARTVETSILPLSLVPVLHYKPAFD